MGEGSSTIEKRTARLLQYTLACPDRGWVAWHPGEPVPVDRGIYMAIFELSRRRQIKVGALGIFTFAPGRYAYVGSAQRGLASRIRRHARQDKTRRWHIDHLAAHVVMEGAWILPGAPKEEECRLARELAGTYVTAAPGFGASDCHCRGHLFQV